jgi:hypothetical protein
MAMADDDKPGGAKPKITRENEKAGAVQVGMQL